MRALKSVELNEVNGGNNCEPNGGYDFKFVISNTARGMFYGWVLPDLATTVGMTAYISNPVMATGALFGGYALTGLVANSLDNYFFPREDTSVTEACVA